MINSSPQISIIVPVLNDTIELRGLLANLTGQEGINFEVLLCDGGSTDDIPGLLEEFATQDCYTLRLVNTAPGRGTQMNAGAAAAQGNTLLFLHADCRFDHQNALLSGFQFYRSHRQNKSRPCAGRFRLHFRRSDTAPALPFFYHEAKARLNRGDCIRGDQGFLIDRTGFDQIGRFDSSLPFLEDVRLAALLAEGDVWALLPADISTSARRFEQEGFYERQVANVIIVNALVTGWTEMLTALPGLYRRDSASGRLSLFPLLDGIRTMIRNHERKWQSCFWKATGLHVASNAWQIFFWLDVRRSFRSGQTTDDIKPYWLSVYEQRLKSFFESGPAGRLAELLTRIWFRWMLYRTKSGKSAP